MTSTIPRSGLFKAPLAMSHTRGHFGESKKKPGTQAYIMPDMPVFRTGTFRDSMGEEATWEQIHLDQMVDYFNMLMERKILADVPVRKYHPDFGGIFGGQARNPMDEMVGYITDLRTQLRENPIDHKEYGYLYAGFEILDVEAQQKIDSGLWRNLSLEVGPTFTNDNAEYWPTVRGVAYVDFPAVQGLRDFSQPVGDSRRYYQYVEDTMSHPLGTVQGPAGTPQLQQPQLTFQQPVQQVSPPAPHEYTIGDKKVTDPAEVQRVLNAWSEELNTLREFRNTVGEQQRENFVQALINDNKLLAPQKDAAITYAKSLSETQFTAWAQLMDAAAPVGILQPHGQQTNNGSTYVQDGDTSLQAGELGAKEYEIEKHRGILETFARTGMTAEKIKATSSYKKLIALDPTFTLD